MRVIFEPDRGQRVPIRLWARAAAPETIRHIGEVLDDQEDLVKRRIRLEPIAVLKG